MCLTTRGVARVGREGQPPRAQFQEGRKNQKRQTNLSIISIELEVANQSYNGKIIIECCATGLTLNFGFCFYFPCYFSIFLSPALYYHAHQFASPRDCNKAKVVQEGCLEN